MLLSERISMRRLSPGPDRARRRGGALPVARPTVEQRGNLPHPDKMAEIHAGARPRTRSPRSSARRRASASSQRQVLVLHQPPDGADRVLRTECARSASLYRRVRRAGRRAGVSATRLLDDGKEISPVARATPAPGRELSFLEQIIGNVGSFNAGAAARRQRAAAAASDRQQGPAAATATTRGAIRVSRPSWPGPRAAAARRCW